MKCHKTNHQDAWVESNGVRTKDGQTTSGWCKPLAGNEEVEGGQETSKGERLKCKRLRFVEEREEAGKAGKVWLFGASWGRARALGLL